MWWRKDLLRFAIVAAIAGTTAACFQPLHGMKSVTSNPRVSDALAAIDVQQISAPSGTPQARVAVELRNAILFETTGGAGSVSPTHRLNVTLSVRRSAIINDLTTGLPISDITAIEASYVLADLRTGKSVITGNAFAPVSSDVPGAQQRFARTRAQRDAENRAVKVVAEQIRTRLASFMVTGS